MSHPDRTRRSSRLALLLAAGTFLAGSCGPADDGTDGATAGGAATDAAVGDTADDGIFIAERDGSAARPETIYYDLTRYEWYARGEPLVHEGRSYMPGGALVAAPLDAMRHLGEFGGVSYYERVQGGDILFVPVHERYWLQFRPREPAAAGG